MGIILAIEGPRESLEPTESSKITNPKEENKRLNRELRSILQSPSYILGQHIAKAYRKPMKVLALPVTIPILAFNLIRGKKTQETNEDKIQITSDESKGARHSVVLFPTNGVGFGHFTRTLAIARKLKKQDPSLEIVFVTTMPTLHPLSEEGFLTYHIPGRYRYKDMEPRVWNSLIEEFLLTVFALHRPKMFLFDGAFPYRGVLNSIKNNESISKIWIRRGMFKKQTKPIPPESINHFDAIIRPGDAVSPEPIQEIEHDAALIRCNPIVLFDKDELYPRGELRSRLGIPEEAIVCYLQLGAGNINDISSDINLTVSALSRHSEIVTVIGESILGERIRQNNDGIRILRDYPNFSYFNDFDFAIMAGGYNSYHEAIQASLPTICYPNLKTGTDDQLSRARIAEKAGSMIVIKKRTKSKIYSAVDQICDENIRGIMAKNAGSLQRANGASQVAKWIIENI